MFEEYTILPLYSTKHALVVTKSNKIITSKNYQQFFVIDFDIFFFKLREGGSDLSDKTQSFSEKKEQKSCIRETLNLSPRNTQLTDKHHTHRGTPYSLGNNLLTTEHPTQLGPAPHGQPSSLGRRPSTQICVKWHYSQTSHL